MLADPDIVAAIGVLIKGSLWTMLEKVLGLTIGIKLALERGTDVDLLGT
jgi:hypothetical protein